MRLFRALKVTFLEYFFKFFIFFESIFKMGQRHLQPHPVVRNVYCSSVSNEIFPFPMGC